MEMRAYNRTQAEVLVGMARHRQTVEKLTAKKVREEWGEIIARENCLTLEEADAEGYLSGGWYMTGGSGDGPEFLGHTRDDAWATLLEEGGFGQHVREATLEDLKPDSHLKDWERDGVERRIRALYRRH